MKGKFIFSYCIVLLFLPFLTGCWDSRDIEKRATILALSIDKVGVAKEDYNIAHFEDTKPDEDMLRISAQISVPGRIPLGPETGGGEGGKQEPVWVLEVLGHTIDDAMLNLQQELADEIFLGHLRMIVLSEEIAREGVERLNDYLRRQPEVRRTVWLVVSKEEAASYMKVAPKLERVPALYLNSMVDGAVDLGKFPEDFIGLFWRVLSSKGQEGFLPYLDIKKRDDIQIHGLAYFQDDKMIGTITPIEIGLFMGAIGEKQGGYGAFINIPNKNDSVLVRAIKRRTKIKTVIKDGKPEIRLKVRYESEIEEKKSSAVKLDDPEIIRNIEKQATKETKESLEKLIKKMQEDESDIFGFGEQIRAKHPDYWDKEVKTKEKWRHIFKDIKIHVDMVTYIRREGMKAK